MSGSTRRTSGRQKTSRVKYTSDPLEAKGLDLDDSEYENAPARGESDDESFGEDNNNGDPRDGNLDDDQG